MVYRDKHLVAELPQREAPPKLGHPMKPSLVPDFNQYLKLNVPMWEAISHIFMLLIQLPDSDNFRFETGKEGSSLSKHGWSPKGQRYFSDVISSVNVQPSDCPKTPSNHGCMLHYLGISINVGWLVIKKKSCYNIIMNDLYRIHII